MAQLIIFTDLDGTLLEKKSYSYEAALPALKIIKRKNVPLVFSTSKTFDEAECYAEEIGLKEPVIVENGGGIFIPEGYFPFEIRHKKTRNGYIVIEIGTSYEKLRKAIDEIRKRGIKVKGFGDMSNRELSFDSGLSIEEAKRARKREFDEPFIIEKGKEDYAKRIIESLGLRFERGGRYCHVTGKNDKGKAVRFLKKLYKKKFGKIETIGLGDSENDKSMLKEVDRAFLIKGGPSEWNSIVLKELKRAGLYEE